MSEKKMRGPGRPKKPDSLTRNISLKVDVDTYDRIAKQASEFKTSKSGVIRMAFDYFWGLSNSR